MKKFSRLSTIQLKILLKKVLHHKKFQVGAIDELKYFKRPLFSIINVEPSNLPGSHWIALYAGKKSNVLEVFDTAGNVKHGYDHYIDNYATLNNLKIVRNNYILQSFDSVMCGYFCIYFLFYKNKGYKYGSVLNLFKIDDTKHNENKVKSFFKRIKFPNVNMLNIRNKTDCNISNTDFASICVQKNKKFTKM